MSKNVEKASTKVLGEPPKASVYDFLYCDTRRIGSFLAQFDDSGHLERVVQKETATIGAKRGFKLGIGGGATLAGTGGTGNAAFEISPEAGSSEASERIYDPLWSNARTFLDYLDGAELLHRGLDGANIGQFILSSGKLALFDLSFLKIAWENPYLKRIILSSVSDNLGNQSDTNSGNRHERKRQDKLSGKATQPDPSEGLLEFVKSLPHGVVSSLSQNGENIWCNLNESFLVGQSSEILLKHGATVPGDWHVVGILDAIPEGEIEPTSLQAMQKLIDVRSLGTLGAMIGALADPIRNMLGRPNTSYGITPLLIFREVSDR